MNPAFSERWARYVMTKQEWRWDWICWGTIAGSQVILAIWLEAGHNAFGTVGHWLLAIYFTYISFHLWERAGFRRLVATKDAQLSELQRQIAAHVAGRSELSSGVNSVVKQEKA